MSTTEEEPVGPLAHRTAMRVVKKRLLYIRELVVSAAKQGLFELRVPLASADLGSAAWWWKGRNQELVGDFFSAQGVDVKFGFAAAEAASYPRCTVSWWEEAKAVALVSARHVETVRELKARSHSGEFVAGLGFVASEFHGGEGRAVAGGLAVKADTRLVRFEVTTTNARGREKLRVVVEGWRALDSRSVTLDAHTLREDVHFSHSSKGGVTELQLNSEALALVPKDGSSVLAIAADA